MLPGRPVGHHTETSQFDHGTGVLDFGCGCGRILRRFARYAAACSFSGIGVEDVEDAGCGESFDFAAFEARTTYFLDRHLWFRWIDLFHVVSWNPAPDDGQDYVVVRRRRGPSPWGGWSVDFERCARPCRNYFRRSRDPSPAAAAE